MHIIRKMVFLELSHNIMIKAKHIPGFQNCMSDALSRLKIHRFRILHPQADTFPVEVLPLQDLLD